MVSLDKDSQCTIMCLEDIGCSQEIIDQYIKLTREKDLEGVIKLLSCQKCRLLDKIHGEQKKLDCIDYIIFHLKKELNQ